MSLSDSGCISDHKWVNKDISKQEGVKIFDLAANNIEPWQAII